MRLLIVHGPARGYRHDTSCTAHGLMPIHVSQGSASGSGMKRHEESDN